MPTTIKRVTEFNRDLVADLFRQAGEASAHPNEDFFSDGNDVMVVAYTDGAPSGFAYAYVLRRPHETSSKMFLYSIDVFPAFRRQGIATKLVLELKALAIAHNCREMFVPTAKSNTAAVGLYRKTGGKVENDDDVTFIYDLP